MPTATDAGSDIFLYRIFNWPANVTFTADMQSSYSNQLSIKDLTPAAAGNYPDMVYAAEERNVPLNV